MFKDNPSMKDMDSDIHHDKSLKLMHSNNEEYDALRCSADSLQRISDSLFDVGQKHLAEKLDLIAEDILQSEKVLSSNSSKKLRIDLDEARASSCAILEAAIGAAVRTAE